MAKIIKNIDSVAHTYCGQGIASNDNYEIQFNEETSWSNCSELLVDIANGLVVVNNGVSDLLDVNEAINFLKDNVPVITQTTYHPPFSAKTLPDGRKLFRRKHGVSGTIAANSTGTINLSVPYVNCKINKVELINGQNGDSVNLKVKDTPTGTISGVPNYMLNQFGFDVYVTHPYYEDTCNYDADLIKDMVVSLEYTNNSSESVTIYWNVCLHEVI